MGESTNLESAYIMLISLTTPTAYYSRYTNKMKYITLIILSISIHSFSIHADKKHIPVVGNYIGAAQFTKSLDSKSFTTQIHGWMFTINPDKSLSFPEMKDSLVLKWNGKAWKSTVNKQQIEIIPYTIRKMLIIDVYSMKDNNKKLKYRVYAYREKAINVKPSDENGITKP